MNKKISSKIKKILSVALCSALLLSFTPTSIFAKDSGFVPPDDAFRGQVNNDGTPVKWPDGVKWIDGIPWTDEITDFNAGGFGMNLLMKLNGDIEVNGETEKDAVYEMKKSAKLNVTGVLDVSPIKMQIDEIVDYATKSPENTNPAVLRSMLEQYGGKSDENSDILYVYFDTDSTTLEPTYLSTYTGLEILWAPYEQVIGIWQTRRGKLSSINTSYVGSFGPYGANFTFIYPTTNQSNTVTGFKISVITVAANSASIAKVYNGTLNVTAD